MKNKYLAVAEKLYVFFIYILTIIFSLILANWEWIDKFVLYFTVPILLIILFIFRKKILFTLLKFIGIYVNNKDIYNYKEFIYLGNEKLNKQRDKFFVIIKFSIFSTFFGLLILAVYVLISILIYNIFIVEIFNIDKNLTDFFSYSMSLFFVYFSFVFWDPFFYKIYRISGGK